MSEPAAFTFCPKCGGPLADGRCANCGWSVPPPVSYSSRLPKRRLLEILIASLVLVVLASVGLNFFLNFESTVQWLPSDVLLWMDDGKGDASAELIRRHRDGKLSDRQLVKLIETRLSDPRLVLRSPFPPGHEQVMVIEQNCRMPLDTLSLQVKDWTLLVDSKEVSNSAGQAKSHAETKTKAKKSERRKPRAGDRQVAQSITIRPLAAGIHTLQLTGELTVFRNKESEELVYARPVSINRDIDIKGELADYAQPRTDGELFERMRNACVAYSWWTGKEDDEYRNYLLSLYAASPGIPWIASVWVRVGSSGDFTKVGEFTNHGDIQMISWGDQLSLNEVPGISEARRIQVRLKPDLAAAFNYGYREFFAAIIEWDSVPVRHRAIGRAPYPTADEYRPPSRVRKFLSKKKKSPPSETDEEV